VSAETDLARLARPSGGLAMVAMDQRESLRTMLAGHRPDPVPDEELVRFKLAVARTVGPHASGFLIDRTYGYEKVVGERLLPDDCGLILAADALVHHVAGGPVEETRLDDAVDPAAARARGVAALKLLVIWRRDADRDARLAMSAEFVRRCAAAGLLSVLEGVVRPGPGATGTDFDDLLLEAARELGGLRPSLYKAQVPRHGQAPPDQVERVCERVTATVPVPWVVLSQGVPVADFPACVRVACRAGASGFLAGRAIWSDTLADPARLLHTRSVDRLRMLGKIVDATARPWQQAAA
jgi:sulfofructosephosphate aldolase